MTRATFIVPCFNEQDNVYRFYNTFFSVFERSPFDWNLVFIDDGSSDDTWSELQRKRQTASLLFPSLAISAKKLLSGLALTMPAETLSASLTQIFSNRQPMLLPCAKFSRKTPSTIA